MAAHIEFVIVGRDGAGRPVEVSKWSDADKAREVLGDTRNLPDLYTFHGPYRVVRRTIREEEMNW